MIHAHSHSSTPCRRDRAHITWSVATCGSMISGNVSQIFFVFVFNRKKCHEQHIKESLVKIWSTLYRYRFTLISFFCVYYSQLVHSVGSIYTHPEEYYLYNTIKLSWYVKFKNIFSPLLPYLNGCNHFPHFPFTYLL